MKVQQFNLIAVLSGLFVAISLLATDYSVWRYGQQIVQVFGIPIGIGFAASSLFMTCLLLGFLLAPAIKEPHELKITVFVLSLVFTITVSYFALAGPTVVFVGLELPYGILFATSLTLGAVGLFMFRFLRKEGESMDFLLVLVMVVNTVINLLYFLGGSAL